MNRWKDEKMGNVGVGNLGYQNSSILGLLSCSHDELCFASLWTLHAMWFPFFYVYIELPEIIKKSIRFQ